MDSGLESVAILEEKWAVPVREHMEHDTPGMIMYYAMCHMRYEDEKTAISLWSCEWVIFKTRHKIKN